jgi:hypothetical protein
MKKLSTLIVSKDEDNKYPKGSYQNPYTDSEFEEMMENGTWLGGFVENIGYIGPSAIIYGYGNINYEYKGSDVFGGLIVPDSGIGGSIFNYKINVNISNGILYIAVLVYSSSGHYDFLATADILVNNVFVDQVRFTKSSEVIYQGGVGWSFIGDTKINLKNYHGHIIVVARIIGNLADTSIGHNSIKSEDIIVYDGNR